MTPQKPQPRYGLRALFMACGAMVIYAVMILITLAYIHDIAGAPAFDMRPMGYDLAEARALLSSLGPDGRHYYLTRQLPLDLIYPALLAGTLLFVFLWLGGRSGITRFGMMVSLVAGAADYFENAGIAAMLMLDDVTVPVVLAASSATVAKSVLTTIAIASAAALWVSRIWQDKVCGGASPYVASRPDAARVTSEVGRNKGV